jgi:hypothetical protein
MLKQLLLFLICFPLIVHAKKSVISTSVKVEDAGPWLTGPLITPSGHVIPFGHVNYEPYIYWRTQSGSYDNHWHYHKATPPSRHVLTQGSFQIGLLPSTELDLSPQFIYKNRGGQHMWRIADFPFALAFQILQDSKDTWWPAIKLHLGATAPIGKYDRLNPKKLGTDSGGDGYWDPRLGFITIKTYHLGGYHYFAWRMAFIYMFTVPVPVHGLSSWGGAASSPGVKGTRGTVYPGCLFSALQGFEYSITHNWALALDIEYRHTNRNRFSGYSPKGTKPVNSSAEIFYLAPAIEYNFNANIGIIAGPYFSVAGRNSNRTPAFLTWVFAVNVYQ